MTWRSSRYLAWAVSEQGRRGTYLGRREVWRGSGSDGGLGGGGGGGGKQASDVGTVGRLIWAGPGRRTPRVGYIYLSSLVRKAVMAELAGALLSVCLILGSILAHCKLYFSLI